jgi:F-type H+-transporting ATPase subunit b
VKLGLTTLALTALLALGAGVVHAQDDEPAAEKAAGDETATATNKATARAARIARKRAFAAARRAAMAMTHAEAAAHIKSAPPIGPLHIAEVDPTAKTENHPSEKAVVAIDALATVDGGIDALPAIAPVNGASAPEHEATAAGHNHEGSAEPGAAHGAAGVGHETHGEAQGTHGEGHGEHAGFSGKTFALQLINFGVLLFILIWFGGRAMNKSLRARHDQLKGDINEAARLRDEAAQKFKAQDQRVADLEKEIAALRASLRQDAEREQARMLEGAQERAKKIQDDMQFQLNQQVKEAELLLRAEVASASVKLAEELVRKAMNTDDERRLAQEFVAGFAGVDGPVGPGGAVG